MTISAELLHSIFEYKDGVLFWKAKKSSNTRQDFSAGSIAKRGYVSVRLCGKHYYVHRLIYMMHYGFMPEFLDHIDGNKLNNKIENLRSATKSENNRNKKLYKNNKSGVKGVQWNEPCKKWRAVLKLDGKNKHIGLFNTIDEAEHAIKEARVKFHGEFSNNG